MLLDFSGILMILKWKLSLWSEKPISNLLIFILISRPKHVALALLPFFLLSSYSFGYISLKLFSNIPPSLIAIKSSIKPKTLDNFLAFSESFSKDVLSISSHNSIKYNNISNNIKTCSQRMKQNQNQLVYQWFDWRLFCPLRY